MPDDASLHRFEEIVQSATQPLVHRYLEEAFRCFAAGACNGAIVMAWNAVACYLRQVVEEISIALFEHNYRVLYGVQNPPSELWRINDNLFIQTCQRMGVLREIIDGLDKPRNRRNDCAHPTGTFVSADETLELVESIREAVSRQVDDERLADSAILREFIKVTEEQEGRAIARWVQNDLCAQLAHDLLTMYDTVGKISVMIQYATSKDFILPIGNYNNKRGLFVCIHSICSTNQQSNWSHDHSCDSVLQINWL